MQALGGTGLSPLRLVTNQSPELHQALLDGINFLLIINCKEQGEFAKKNMS
jgi:hypothetical protein